jgi:FMN phosphatase YigB (HAD superfamily)
VPFQAALRALGVVASETVHVGDSLQNDIEPALALGMTAVLRTTEPQPPDAPYHTITSLAELPSVLERLR